MVSILLSVTCMQTLEAHIFQILGLLPSQPGALLETIHESTSQTINNAGRSERDMRMELVDYCDCVITCTLCENRVKIVVEEVGYILWTINGGSIIEQYRGSLESLDMERGYLYIIVLS